MTLTDDNIAAYADTLVLQVKSGGGELNYSEVSVEVLENLLSTSDELLQAGNFPETQRNLLVFYNGCYLGEVMARTLNGAWKFEENWYDSSLIFPEATGSGLQIFPFQKVFRRITEGPAGNNLVDYYEVLKGRLRPA